MNDSIYAAGGKVDSFTENHLLPTNIYLSDFQPKDPHFWKALANRVNFHFTNLTVLWLLVCLLH